MENPLCNEEIVSQGPISLLTKVYSKPQSMPVTTLDNADKLSDDEKHLIQRIGISTKQLESDIQEATLINFERSRIYKEVDRALLHWMVGSSMELYADYATTYSTLHNASVWITSRESKISNELNSMLERIGIEERIFDWAHTVASYGDMFVKIEAQPTLGVVSVCDDEHPVNISRVDNRGVLIGFFETPLGLISAEKPLLAPWEYVHFRILGSKRKRPLYDDPMYSEYRTIHLMAPDTRRVSASYGCSLMMNALPVYKRLRLAEDSLLLARLTRGVMKYIYKVKVDSNNIEAVSAILDEVATTLKRARALDISEDTANYDSKSNPMASVEDIVIPVWNDANDLTIEKIGGEADIKWIVDIEELRNQLASALRTPLSLLGGFVDEATGALGSSSIEKLDIRFARSARRLQRSLKEGIKRICQVHLAHINMDPDPSMFEVNMSETSSAEEEQLKDSLSTGMDVISKVFGKRILKLNDVDFKDFVETGKISDSLIESKRVRKTAAISDLRAHLPSNNSNCRRSMNEWKKLYGKCKVQIKSTGKK